MTAVADDAPKAIPAPVKRETTLTTLRHLWPYMWPSARPDLKWRVVWALGVLVAAKIVTVLVPYTYKWATDALTAKPALGADGTLTVSVMTLFAVPIMLVDRQRRRPHPDERVQQPARRALRQGRPARRAQSRLQHLRPHARAVAALSPAAADRRPVAHHRARRQRHRDDRPLHHPQHAADVSRVRLRRGGHRLPVRLEVPRRRRVTVVALRLVHGEGLRLAHQDPPDDERIRPGRPLQGDRLAAQLRDGQIFRQREDGGDALRPRHGAIRGSRGPDLDVARLAEHRPDRHLHRRHDGLHGDVGASRSCAASRRSAISC